MTNLFKWVYNLGVEHERKRLHRELLMYIGQKPERTNNPELNYLEDEKSFNGRLRVWGYANRLLADFFEQTDWDK